MDTLLVQTALIFVVAAIGYCNSVLSSALLNRPIVLGALTGLALGDLSTGCMVGATLELVYLGAQAIGASNPPDMTSGSVIGTAYVIAAGADVAEAVAIAVPVSLLMSIYWNFLMAVVGPIMSARADKRALACDRRGVDAMHLLFVLIQVVTCSALCAAGFFVGAQAIQGIVNSIPSFITDGLNYAMGLIPAIGFAMLTRMIINKKLACFLFLGFLLVAYGGMNIVGVTACAAVLAAILVFYTSQGGRPALEVDTDDDDF
ncbi:MAG: PTS sugar transporter subunit IIC [Collinsella sp.]|nr:PTS sugar transporter subunit IIC [Collinsella sp.]